MHYTGQRNLNYSQIPYSTSWKTFKNARSVTECEECFEKLNHDVNRLVIKRYGKTTEGPTSNEQKDSGEVEETPLEGQNTPEQERQTPPLQPKISVAPGGQPLGTTSDESPLVQPISQMRKDPPNNLIFRDKKTCSRKFSISSTLLHAR